MITLTQQTGILFPIAWLLGQIFNGLFNFLYWLSNLTGLSPIANIGICVVLFTIVTRLAMLPLTIKQQRFSKLSNMMQPEIQAIQAKYNGQKDNQSMLKMQEETKAVYEKYGTNPSSGCLTMLIQLPIMFALYRVIYKIPGYVTKIKAVLGTVAATIIGSGDGWLDTYNKATGLSLTLSEKVADSDTLIDSLYTLPSSGWDAVVNTFGDNIQTLSDQIQGYNNLFGISLTQAPGWRWSWALIIPLLAGVTQFISAKLMENRSKVKTTNGQEDQGQTMQNSMKIMNTIMPLVSVFFCITLPTCIGLYWITSSVVQIIQQLFINHSVAKMDVEEMVQKNIDKVNAKRAKKGLPPKKIENSASAYAEAVKKQEAIDARMSERDAKVKESNEYYSKGVAKPGSLAAKANMVKMFNERNEAGSKSDSDSKSSKNDKSDK